MFNTLKKIRRGKQSFIGNCSMILLAVIVVGSFVSPSIAGAANPKEFTHRIVWPCQGLEKRTIDTCIGRLRAAASLGYNGYIIEEHAFNHLENAAQEIFDNAERVKAEARKHSIELIPHHFYQGNVAYDNYNLAEAFPVRGTKFKVSGGEAHALCDHQTGFQNGGFESVSSGKPDGWRIIGIPGAAIETSGPKAGDNCLRLSGGGKYSRIEQRVTLKPFRAYRLSAWVSTKGCSDWQAIKFAVELNPSQGLLNKRYRPFGTPSNPVHKGVWTTLSISQGWRLCQTDFNSLNNTSAKIQFVVSRQTQNQTGTVWLDEVKMEEVGLYETVRRKNCPIVVTSIDGKTTYKEGTDYIVDPKCSDFQIDNFWYQGWMKIPSGSAIRNGQELRVSWYQMSDIEQISPEANFCLPETRDAFTDNVSRIDRVMASPGRYFFGYDEWRTAFWDDRCELFPKARTAGEYMKEALQMSIDIVRKPLPDREIFIIDDMFSPYFNAWNPYAMNNGGCLNSWKDMDTSLIIYNWRPYDPWDRLQLRFFMGIDDSLNPEGKVWRQVMYVDNSGAMLKKLNMIEAAERDGGRGVVGICYISWFYDYTQMGAVANACKNRGRWGKDPLPPVAIRDKPSTGPKGMATGLTVKPISNGKSIVSFNLPEQARVNLEIHDLQGRVVQPLASGKHAAGKHKLEMNTSRLASGVYFLRLSIDGQLQSAIRQLIL